MGHQPLLRFLGKILPVLFDPTKSPVNLGRMRLFQSKFRFYDVDKVHQDRRFQRAVYVLLLIRRSGTPTFCLWSSTLTLTLSLSLYIYRYMTIYVCNQFCFLRLAGYTLSKNADMTQLRETRETLPISIAKNYLETSWRSCIPFHRTVLRVLVFTQHSHAQSLVNVYLSLCAT